MTTEEMAVQLSQLELRVSRMKRLLLLMLLVPASVFTLGQASRPTFVVASDFILQDADGMTRAHLYMTDLGPAFVMLDGSGTPRVALAAKDEGTQFRFFAKGKVLRLNLETTETSARVDTLSSVGGTRCFIGTDGGRPQIAVGGPDGSRAVIMQVRDQSPELRLVESQNARAELAYHPAGPMLRLFEAGEQPRVTLTTAGIGSGVLLKGPNDQGRALLSVDTQGRPSLQMNDGSGRIVLSLP
jgi:hypothetical protein